MKYRNLGNTGLRVSAIALGCEGFMGKTPEQVRSDFDFAEMLGINFFDCYSSNPDLRSAFGAALEGRRERYVIQGHLCSYWENGQYDRTRDVEKVKVAFDDLLTRFGTDYVDVGMIHYVDDEADFHKVFDGDVIKYALQLKSEGVIRHIGISSHNPLVAKMAVESGLVEVLLFSINPCYDMQPPTEEVEDLWAEKNYEHPLENIAPEREALYEFCERCGVGIDVMKVYGGGDILSETDSPFGKALTPVQCIEYALTRPSVAAVMCGCKTTDEIKAAAAWCDASESEKDYASVMAQMKKFTWRGHCMYCGHCAPCSAGIDIASVNKFLKLAGQEGEIPETVREHYKVLDSHASDCLQCGLCEDRCPFGVHIIESMQRAAERFGF
jgi:predicted aldo/keto reductase-like oxidoreductase